MAFFDGITRLLQSSDAPETQPGYASPKLVDSVSKVLNVTEFEVFRIAYHQWYGIEATDQDIERDFTHYIFEHKTPHWVRHFCVNITRLHSSGKLEPTEFTQPQDRRAGMSKNILVA